MELTMVRRFLPVTLRILLGLIFLATSLIGLILQPEPPPDFPARARAFADALEATGYMNPLVTVVQLASAASLLLNLWLPLMLVVLAPVTVNILLFHVFLTPNELFTSGLPGVVVFVLHVALLWIYRESYRPLLLRKPAPAP
jgi:hypothetical protein